jgi:hypothetical protein
MELVVINVQMDITKTNPMCANNAWLIAYNVQMEIVVFNAQMVITKTNPMCV